MNSRETKKYFRKGAFQFMLTLTTAQMKKAEQLSDRSGLSYGEMMENAGRTAYQYLENRYGLADKSCVILAGSGNNGGDGFVIARRLLEAGGSPLVLLGCGLPKTVLAKENYERFCDLGGKTDDLSDGEEEALFAIQGAQIIIDALFGTGFHGEVPYPASALLACANSAQAVKVALDVPSGINADTGESGEICFQGDVTLAFGACKPAHNTLTAKASCGRIEVLDIGIPAAVIAQALNDTAEITVQLVKSLLPVRSPEAHKGVFGKLLVLAGSRRMPGASMMCTMAALRMGAGTVTLASPESVSAITAPHLMEAMPLPLPETSAGGCAPSAADTLLAFLAGATAFVAGCGLTAAPETLELLRKVLPQVQCPLVLDADGLNCVSKDLDLLKNLKAPAVLTPHPGEMARLAGMTVEQVNENSVAVAKLFAREYGVTVVLKGHRTIVALPDGKLFQNTTGNAGLAKGGSGDVLAGMIGALAAQGILPQDAALCGVCLHGLAADRLDRRMSQYSMLARDVIEEIPFVLKDLDR